MSEESSTSQIKKASETSSRRLPFSSMHGRLIVLLLLVLVPILLVEAYFSYERYQYRKNIELQANLEVGRALATAFDAFVKDVLRQELAIGIAATASPPLSPSEFTRLLDESAKDSPAVRAFLWVNPRGYVIASSNPEVIGMDISERPYFKEIGSGRDWLVTDLLGSKLKREEGEPIFGIVRSFRDENGNLLGMALASLVPANLDKVLAIQRTKDAGVSLVDSKGIHVYRYPSSGYSWEQRNWLKIYPEIEDALKGKEVASTVTSVATGKKRLVGFIPVSSIGWVAAASRAEDEVLGPIISDTAKQISLTLLVSLISFLVALALSRKITRSVANLQKHALSLGRGETGHPVTATGPAELEDLAGAFNTMAEQLQCREKSLRQSQERFRTFSEATFEGIAITKGGRFLDVNDQLCSITGYDRSELIGLEVAALLLAEECDRVLDNIFSERESVTEHRVVCKDGGIATVEAHGKSVRGNDGVFRYTAIRDITGRKEAEKALRHSEEQLRLVIDSVPALISYIDKDFRYRFNNKAYEEWFGRSRSEIYGKHVRDVLGDTAFETLRDYFDAALSGERVSYERLAPYKDGGARHILGSYIPHIDEEGHVRGMVVLVNDITQHKRMEEELLEREHFARKVIESSLNGLYIYDLEQERNVYINPVYTRITGYTLHHLLSAERLHSLFHPDDSPSIANHLDEMRKARDGETIEVEYRFKTIDGRWIWCLSRDTVFERDEEGKVRQFIGSFLDITERFEAERALRESEERLRLLGDNLPESAVYQYAREPDGSVRFLYFSAGIERLNGVSVQDVLCDADTLHRQIPREYYERLIEAEARSARELSDFDMEVPMKRPDGELRWMQLHSRPRCMPDGRLIWDGVQTDVTERNHMEEELRRSRDELEIRVQERTSGLIRANQILQLDEARFEALYELSKMSDSSRKEIADFVLEHLVTLTSSKMAWIGFMNADESATLVHSWSQSAMKECSILDKPLHFPTHSAGVWAQCIRERNVVMLNDYASPHEAKRGYPEGHVEICRLLSVPVFDGERIVAVGVVANKEEGYDSTDVQQMNLLLSGMWKHTKQKEASEELQVYAQRLQESNQALQDFASIASHDMQEPLRKVSTFGNILQQKYGDTLGESGKDYVNRMLGLGATDRMQILLKSLLEYSRVSSRAEPFKRVELSSIVRDVLSDLEVRISSTGGEVQLGELPVVEADPTQMRQLFQNLIGNGLKFHKEGQKPVVKVHCSEDSSGACTITVEDNGIGFDEKYLEKIFAPFERLHGRSAYEGTGMGLAICKKIVERHGGSITARSEPGIGSRFIIGLPSRKMLKPSSPVAHKVSPSIDLGG